MNIRRLFVATVALVGALATVAAEAAPAYRLDGDKRRSRSYSGTLTSPIIPLGSVGPEPEYPRLSDCTPTSCDTREIELVLPKGTTWGQFRAKVVSPVELNVALMLFRQNGERVAHNEVWVAPDAVDISCCSQPVYELAIEDPWVRAGTYILAVVDRAGAGRFSVTAEWEPHPPDRKTS